MIIKVLVVDDHELIREGIVSLLSGETDIEIAATYSAGNALMTGIVQHKADVVLLDLQLEHENGLAWLLKVKEQFPAVKVLILSSNENIHNIGLLLKSGASGYLFKNTRMRELAAGIRHVMHHDTPYLLPEVAQFIHSKNKSLSSLNTLTPRELEVLQLIAKELTSQEIAAQLGISHRTIEIYRLGLMQKMDAKNMVGMVKKAIMLGLIKE